jgi:predicted PhzF superfamily epimerase YddE/YHI9
LRRTRLPSFQVDLLPAYSGLAVGDWGDRLYAQHFRERYSTCDWRSSLSLHNAASGDCRNRADLLAHYRRRERFERRFQCVQIDVFTSQRLQGNPLAVFTDARGLSDTEMQDLARETNLQETTFVLPRDAATERELGVKVRIFVPEQEIPFGGHPTLGTAMVLRSLRLARNKSGGKTPESVSEITLDLKVGKVPVSFREDAGDWPIQTISTGLPFAVVPLKHLSTLQSLRIDSTTSLGTPVSLV